MSTSKIDESAEAFKPVDIMLTVTSKDDKDALVEAIRRGVIEAPTDNAFTRDLSLKLQRL